MDDMPSELNVLSLNCWGLKYISTLRRERLKEIGKKLSEHNPPLHFVGLQELWTQEDYRSIREQTRSVLPYGKFYFGGSFGAGLAILSRWPILESSLRGYPLNGRPNAFYHGDWYVGKGVACAKVRIGPGRRDIVEIFTTHLHAPYEPHPNDSYLCHRTAQAWEIAKLMRGAAQRGHLVLALGDFNMIPLSLAHRIIETHSPCKDIWRVLHPDSSIGSHNDEVEKARGRPVPTADYNRLENGTCSDSVICTWRWNKNQQNAIGRGRPKVEISGDTPDPGAKRLDYIFASTGVPLGDGLEYWTVEEAHVGMTERHPELDCSLSDHFAVVTTLRRHRVSGDGELNAANGHGGSQHDLEVEQPDQSNTIQLASTNDALDERYLPITTYDEILQVSKDYNLRQRFQRRIRSYHFFGSVLISTACLTGVWWTPNYGSFLLMLLSTLNLAWGVIDGLQALLFVGSELRALKEFEWEIKNARAAAGGQGIDAKDEAVIDW